MKADEIRDMDDAEMEYQLEQLREEEFRLRFRRAMMELENPKLIRRIRRDIARILTIQRERREAS